jgi:hypothetical protein
VVDGGMLLFSVLLQKEMLVFFQLEEATTGDKVN